MASIVGRQVKSKKTMSEINDYNIYQNYAIGAHALWEFCKSYQEYHDEKKPPILLLALPLLAIVFNERATEAIKNRNFKEGSLYKTITENKDIYSGLQERMENSLDLTLKSINIASASNLIIYDRDTTMLIVNSKFEPQKIIHSDYKDIILASKRIGAWFAQLNLQEITTLFNIKF
jgi:hypothetical protein